MFHRKHYQIGTDIISLAAGYIRQIIQPLLSCKNTIVPAELNGIIIDYGKDLFMTRLYTENCLNAWIGCSCCDDSLASPIVSIGKPKSLTYPQSFFKTAYKSGNNLFLQTNTNQLMLYKSSKYMFKTHPFFNDKLITFVSNSYHGKHVIIGTENEIYAYGNNAFYELGIGKCDSRVKTPTPVQLPSDGVDYNIIDACCGENFTTFLSECGHILSAGYNIDGRCGQKVDREVDYEEERFCVDQITVISGVENIVSINCGQKHVLCLNKDGQLFSWGSNAMGKSCHPQEIWRCESPKLVEYFKEHKKGIKDFKCGFNHSCVINVDGRVYIFGHIDNKIYNEEDHYLLRELIEENVRIDKMDCGKRFIVLLSTDHELYCVGKYNREIVKTGRVYKIGYDELRLDRKTQKIINVIGEYIQVEEF